MTLTEAWMAYMSVLRGHAPVTAASVRPALSPALRLDAERATAPWTEELREFFSLHDGQSPPDETHPFPGTALPNLTLLSLDEVVATHKFCRESLHDTDDLGPDWATDSREQPAGEVAYMFLDAYVPFAEDSAGGYLCVDTRSGEHHGCVRSFSSEAADEGGPLFASMADYIDSVRRSVESGDEHSFLKPTFEEGTLVWKVDFSDSPIHEPQPEPEPELLRLPFALADFQPSQVGPDDDLIDLDVVRQTVLDTARSLHPDAVVEGGRTVFPRVPRRRGVTMNSFVSVDGEPKPYLTIVTGVGNEVLVHEVPPDGFTFTLGGHLS